MNAPLLVDELDAYVETGRLRNDVRGSLSPRAVESIVAHVRTYVRYMRRAKVARTKRLPRPEALQ